MINFISLNYPCLEQIFMALKVFEPLKFYSSLLHNDYGQLSDRREYCAKTGKSEDVVT